MITFFNTHTKISRDVYTKIKDIFGSKVFKSSIPQNVKISEAQSHGKAIFDYDIKCKGAKAYLGLAKEVIERINHEQSQQYKRQNKEKAVATGL